MSSGETNYSPPVYPVKGEFIFENKQVQTAANAVYEHKAAYDAANAAKGKKYQFKTDRERMQYLIGRQGRVVHSTVVPTPPLMVGGAVENGSIVLNWQPPLKSEAPVLYYKVVSNPPTTTVLSVTAPAIITGLTAGIAYTFSVYAKNVAGFSLPGVSAPITFATAPSPPRNVVATAGDASALVAWDPPVTDGGSTIIDYRVISSSGVTRVQLATNPNSLVFFPLTNGTTYTFTVVAHNVIDNSDPSVASNSVTPSAPSGETVTANLTGIVFDGSTTYYQNTFTFPSTNTLTINLTNVGASISVATHIDFQNASDPLLLNSADTFVLTNPSYTPNIQYVTYGGGAYSQIYANEAAGFITATSKVVVTFTDARTSVAFKIS
uniref:Fibronectin type-III domain-containing protein n=1 Tax=viral metagenome TaxID=1070528 RepID=A0A6C0BBI7_9ZZZZ